MVSAISPIQNQYEREVLHRLFSRYYGVMLKCALSICTVKHEAEDIVIEAMMSLFDKAPLLDSLSEKACAAYLVRTVKRQAVAFVVKEGRKREFTTDNMEELITSETIITPEELSLLRERTQQIGQALEKLPERDRLLLVYRYYLQMTTDEMAKMLHTNKRNISAYLSRARQRALPLIKEALQYET